MLDREKVHINLRDKATPDDRFDIEQRIDASNFKYQSPYSKLPPLNINRKTTPQVKYRQKELDTSYDVELVSPSKQLPIKPAGVNLNDVSMESDLNHLCPGRESPPIVPKYEFSRKKGAVYTEAVTIYSACSHHILDGRHGEILLRQYTWLSGIGFGVISVHTSDLSVEPCCADRLPRVVADLMHTGGFARSFEERRVRFLF